MLKCFRVDKCLCVSAPTVLNSSAFVSVRVSVSAWEEGAERSVAVQEHRVSVLW